MATVSDNVEKTPVALLPTHHRETVTRAVRNVLSTDIAQITYAQIIDGVPIASVSRDTYDFGTFPIDHHLHDKHEDLCPGVTETAKRLWAEFDLDSLRIPHQASNPRDNP